MIAELRMYTVKTAQVPAVRGAFETVIAPLFDKHGICHHGPWLRRLDRGHQLVYVVEFADPDERAQQWSDFRSDPMWLAYRSTHEDDFAIESWILDG